MLVCAEYKAPSWIKYPRRFLFSTIFVLVNFIHVIYIIVKKVRFRQKLKNVYGNCDYVQMFDYNFEIERLNCFDSGIFYSFFFVSFYLFFLIRFQGYLISNFWMNKIWIIFLITCLFLLRWKIQTRILLMLCSMFWRAILFSTSVTICFARNVAIPLKKNTSTKCIRNENGELWGSVLFLLWSHREVFSQFWPSASEL